MLKTIFFSFKPENGISIRDNEYSINFVGEKTYEISELEETIKELKITNKPVQEAFSNKHTAREISAYLLRDYLNSQNPNANWEVTREDEESLFLHNEKNGDHDFHVIEHVIDGKDSCAHLKEDIKLNKNIKKYLFADIRDLQKENSNKQRKVTFYLLNFPIAFG